MRTLLNRLADTIKENLLLSIAFSLLLLFIAYYVWQDYTSEKITITQYSLNERAKVNPYYASELLINAQAKNLSTGIDASSIKAPVDEAGVNSKKNSNSNKDTDSTAQASQAPRAITQMDMDLPALIRNLPELLEEQGDNYQHSTLVMRRLNKTITDNHAQALLDWVEQGGHLITFFHRSSEVEKEDWQKVENRLTEIKEQLNIDTNQPITTYQQELAEAINNDSELQQALTEIYKDKDEIFWQKLGVYLLEKDNKKGQEKFKQDLNRELDKLTKSQEKNNFSEPARHIIEDFANRYSRRVIVNNQQNQQLMLNANENNYLYDELLFASHPQARPHNEFSPANAQQIRQYFKNKLAKVDQLLAKLTSVNKDKNDFKKELIEQQSAFRVLLQLSDNTLQQLFSPLNQVMVDVDYGKGRITLLKSAGIFGNPNASKIRVIHREKELLEKGIIPENIRNDWGFIPSDALYSQEHAQLLLDLTRDSDKVWLFPNISIDSLLVMLWKNARLATFGLGFLTLIWLWSLYNRFGKRQYLSNNQSADIFRYFRQVGRYGWEYDNGKQLSNASRQQTLKLVKKALVLQTKAPLNQDHIAKLSQLLQQQFIDKLETESDVDTSVLDNLRADKESYLALLQPAILHSTLLPTNDELDTMNAREFTLYTQALWLIKWLLK